MTHVIRIVCEFTRTDGGFRTLRITEREGSSGENPPQIEKFQGELNTVADHSLTMEKAQKEIFKSLRSAHRRISK